jgi:hypothetical protein
MKHALNVTGSWLEWDGRSFRDADGFLHQSNIASLWTEAERKAVGLYPIIETDIPDDKISAGWTLTFDADADTVTRTHTLANKPAPPVPDVISMRQARLVLLSQGLLAQVDATIAAMDEPARSAALIEWEYATELRRDNPLVVAMQGAMDLTDEQVDAMFTAGSAIP